MISCCLLVIINQVSTVFLILLYENCLSSSQNEQANFLFHILELNSEWPWKSNVGFCLDVLKVQLGLR